MSCPYLVLPIQCVLQLLLLPPQVGLKEQELGRDFLQLLPVTVPEFADFDFLKVEKQYFNIQHTATSSVEKVRLHLLILK